MNINYKLMKYNYKLQNGPNDKKALYSRKIAMYKQMATMYGGADVKPKVDDPNDPCGVNGPEFEGPCDESYREGKERKRQEEERKKRQEDERKKREEEERKKREEEERKKREEEERKKREEEERKKREEEERKKREEEEKAQRDAAEKVKKEKEDAAAEKARQEALNKEICVVVGPNQRVKVVNAQTGEEEKPKQSYMNEQII